MDCSHEQHRVARQQTFGYLCRACSRCCHGKIIQVNPYEIARLARNLGIGTSEFRSKWTEEGKGTVLARTADDTCVFLGRGGCTVHSDRPLVCRLYPLGRRFAPDGSESWLELQPHPRSEGEYTERGTIADYLATQHAESFIEAADAYVNWVNEARTLLLPRVDDAPSGAAGETGDLLDMDKAIARHAAITGAAEPEDIEARKDLHLAILYEELEQLKGAADGEELSRD
jgi:Fe-S-cluster containining protein